MKIDEKLVDMLNRTGLIYSVLYYPNPKTAVIFKNPDDDKENPFYTVTVDECTPPIAKSANHMKNIIIDKLREFGFLRDYHATAMSLGHVGLISFVDGPTIRFDVKPQEFDQLTIPMNIESVPNLIDNKIIKGIILYLIDAFNDDKRFNLFWNIGILDNPDVVNIYIESGTVSTKYKEYAPKQFFKVSFTQTARR